MKKTATRYPSYDVTDEQSAWDEHTRSIVLSRLHTSSSHRFLTEVEAETLRACCCQLLDEHRPEIIQFVLDHIDHKLCGGQESERKPGVPPQAELVRRGLRALDAACQAMYTNRYFHLDDDRKKQLLSDISIGESVPYEPWEGVPQAVFFRKLLTLAVEGCYSHPKVWSEIGYGGPAYPRGYVRMKQLDPWEAREEDRRDDT